MKQETSYQHVGQVLSDNKVAPCGESTAKPGRGVLFSPSLVEKSGRSGVNLTNKRGICLDDVRFTPDLHPKWRSAFTLIELLIVVLIIAILAAVAVPQYQKAVLKSRFSSLMPLAKALNDSEEAYYLEHSAYTNDKTKLDITTADTKANVTLGNESQHKYVRLTRGDIKNQLTVYQKHSPNFAGETHCEAEIDNTLANWLCQESLKGTYIGDKYGYTVYSLSENWEGSLDRKYYDLRWVAKTFTDGDVCEVNTTNYGCSTVSVSGDMMFTNGAKCVANNAYYGCDGTYYSAGTCIANANAKSGCSSVKMDHSYCVGNSGRNGGSCWGTFKNNSICYANAGGNKTCTGTYDATSCCAGAACKQDKCADKGIEAPAQPTY